MRIPFVGPGTWRNSAASRTQKYLAIGLILLGLVTNASSFNPGASIRAVCISYVSNAESLLTATAMESLEQHFNGKYGYHWALFSREPLSTVNKEMLSNLTCATVTFNIIPDKHWTLPVYPQADPGELS